MGLGLTVGRKIIETHRGKVEIVAPKSGQGGHGADFPSPCSLLNAANLRAARERQPASADRSFPQRLGAPPYHVTGVCPQTVYPCPNRSLTLSATYKLHPLPSDSFLLWGPGSSMIVP